jgi:hypothetical protein
VDAAAQVIQQRGDHCHGFCRYGRGYGEATAVDAMRRVACRVPALVRACVQRGRERVAGSGNHDAPGRAVSTVTRSGIGRSGAARCAACDAPRGPCSSSCVNCGSSSSNYSGSSSKGKGEECDARLTIAATRQNQMQQ